MAAITTIAIPIGWLTLLAPEIETHRSESEWIRARVREILVRAITSPPEQPVSARAEVTPKITINVSLPDPAGGIAMAQAKARGLTLGQYCKQVLATLPIPESGDSLAEVIGAEWLRSLTNLMAANGQKMEYRREQAAHFAQVHQALEQGNIGLCEAGTGTGKTLAMVAAALKAAMDHNSRVTITVPSLALLGQFAEKYREVVAAVPSLPPLRAVMGRREFVSPVAVSAALNWPEFTDRIDSEAVRSWLQTGAPNGPIDRPWLAASLLAISPDFPIQEVVLGEIVDVDDPGFQAYRAQFNDDRAVRAEIMLCTHALLAIDMRGRLRLARRDEGFTQTDKAIYKSIVSLRDAKKDDKSAIKTALVALSEKRGQIFADLTEEEGLLPGYQFVLVDEAHLLESNFSSALSDYLSLQAMLRELDHYRAAGGKFALTKLQEVRHAVRELAALGAERSDQTLQLRGDADAGDVTTLLARIATLIGDLPTQGKKQWPPEQAASHLRIRKMASLLRSATGELGALSYLQWSPVRAYPQLIIGRSSVDQPLRALWESVQGGAAVSATLYLQKGEQPSATYIGSLLAVPTHRLREFPPVAPAWLITTVEGVYLPKAKQRGNRIWLRPPSRVDKLDVDGLAAAEQLWLDEIAEALMHISTTAVGGMLVLATSYSSVKSLVQRLPELSERIVIADPDRPLNVQASKYLALLQKGLKPVWLAVGAAWTGLDIGGHDPWARMFGSSLPPDQDQVLTDLVVLKLPYGTNRTITHRYRVVHRPGVPWELLDTAFRLRQGLGRPVRRAGLTPNRRFFILDGRLNDPIFANAFSLIRSVLKRYTLREFDL